MDAAALRNLANDYTNGRLTPSVEAALSAVHRTLRADAPSAADLAYLALVQARLGNYDVALHHLRAASRHAGDAAASSAAIADAVAILTTETRQRRCLAAAQYDLTLWAVMLRTA